VNREACSWQACLYKADDAVLDVHLIWEGKSFTKKRVPLCGGHLVEFGRTKRMTLKPEMLLTPEPR
jgi:hypothetical protein